MAKKKKGDAHGGGHGWFVTFADLMALMMSFFVMLVAFSTQDQKKLQIVAGSMRDAFGVQKDSRLSGIVELDGIPTKPNLKNIRHAPPEEASDRTAPSRFERREDGLSVTAYDRAFALAAASLRQALQDMPEIAELSKNIIVEETREGLNISLTDQDGRAMFPSGSKAPFERTRLALEVVAGAIRKMPNRVSVTGHTSVARPGSPPGDNAWDLSIGRAASVRDILALSGVPDERFFAVTGKGDTDPVFPDNPYLPSNRRITILLMKEAPPIPFGQRP